VEGINYMEKDKEEVVTLSGNPADPDCINSGAPQKIDPETGMHKDYWVLSEEERAKGFVRPYRDTYTHTGIRPIYELRILTDEEQKEHLTYGYIAFEKYPESESPRVGRYWTKEELESGCNKTTTMGNAIAETYARNPKFYGATFCSYCKKHFLVGENGEFVWLDGTKVGI